MSMTQPFFTVIGNIVLVSFWFTWWFKLIMFVVTAIALVIFHYVRIRRMKNIQSQLESQLLERKELLSYSVINEQRATDKALQADRNKGLLMSRINHELRTPMNGVLGMAVLLKETDLTPEQQEYTNEIMHSGDKLMKVINEIMMTDILEYSKVESGKDLEAKDIDLSNCIEEVLDVFAAKAAKAGIDLLYHIEDNVPQQIVGDVKRLRQIMMNLVENAIKVTRTGEIFIGARMVNCKEDNSIKLEFEIRDTGAGMTEERKNQLSKTLGAQNGALNTEVSSGVGLIICKRLVALMGGAIQLESTQNVGTTVRFSILSKAGMQPMVKQTNSEIAGLKGKRILIVDDNATARELLSKQLENLQMVTTSTGNGKEALEILTQVSFDLIITDLAMPEMDGIELTENIRKKYPSVPVILLKPFSDEQAKVQAEIFGAILNKPVKNRQLLDAILNQLRNKDNAVVSKQNTVHKLSDQFSKQYPLKILIAEDNPLNQKWTSKILSKLGYQTEIAQNGKEVLEVVSTRQYDLILMDVQMPEMDGLEATRMIRLCLDTQPVIIAMTANVMQGDRQDCMQSGMDDYISKPVELNELVAMLEKWALLIKEKKPSPQLVKKMG